MSTPNMTDGQREAWEGIFNNIFDSLERGEDMMNLEEFTEIMLKQYPSGEVDRLEMIAISRICLEVGRERFSPVAIPLSIMLLSLAVGVPPEASLTAMLEEAADIGERNNDETPDYS